MPKHKYELEGWEENGDYKAIDSTTADSKTEAMTFFREKYADDEAITFQYIVHNTANTREVSES